MQMHEAPGPVRRFVTRLWGRTADHCGECGAKVDPATEFRVLPMQVFCNEAHAVAYQQNNPL